MVEVCGFSGVLCQIPAECTSSLHETKAAIEVATGIKAREQRLFAGTVPFDDDLFKAALAAGGVSALTLARRRPLQAMWLELVQVSWQRLCDAPLAIRSDSEVVTGSC